VLQMGVDVSLFKALEDAAMRRGEAPKTTAEAAVDPFGRRPGLSKGRIVGAASTTSLDGVPFAGQLGDVIEARPRLSDLLENAQGETQPQATYDPATDTIDLREPASEAAGAPLDIAPVVTEPCERCGEPAERDLFDRFSRKAYFSCGSCGLMWQQTMSS